MDVILGQLRELFLQGLPTVILVFALLLILEPLFFRPLTDVLKRREEQTSGAVARARELAAAAQAKAEEYEAAYRNARQEVYRLREADRVGASKERDERLREARAESEALLRRTEASVAGQVSAAKAELEKSSQALAEEITETILSGAAPGPQKKEMVI